jgi:protein subunit release factor A
VSREVLFSVTADDCEWAYTRGTGAGGQKKNKTSSAVHCTHRPSGAHGYSEETRSQAKNRELAFKKMAESKEFKAWHGTEVLRRNGTMAIIDANVEREMRRVKVEKKNHDGRWEEWSEPK